jgi:fructose-1-phosphate kinase PfkB-like protein
MLRQAAVPDVHGNSTGAGDAATAGIVSALTAGAPLGEALRWGAVLGAAAVVRPTAGEVRRADLAVLSARLPAGPAVPMTSDRPTSLAPAVTDLTDPGAP